MHSANKPSILMVSHKYPPATGGMEKQSYELIQGMHQHAHVYPLVFDGSESIIRFFRKLNQRILRIIRQHPEISIIHFNDGLIASLSLYHKGYDHLCKVVTLHGLDVVFPWRRYQKKVLPRFDKFDRLVAVSQATATALINRGIDPDKVSVIANGIDPSWAKNNSPTLTTAVVSTSKLSAYDEKKEVLAQIPAGKSLLLLLGRPVTRKGFSWFMEQVLPHLDSRYHLLLVGPFSPKANRQERLLKLLPSRLTHLISLFLGFPTDQGRLRELLAESRFADRATHLGKLSEKDLHHVLGKSTAFLMPNVPIQGDMEGFGLVCLEASSRGAVVFAAALEGITDAIHPGKNGFLIASGHARAWADALNDFLEECPEKREALRKKFSQYTLETFGWDKMTYAYYQLFLRVQKI